MLATPRFAWLDQRPTTPSSGVTKTSPFAENTIADTNINAIAARLERDRGCLDWEDAVGAKDLANERMLIRSIAGSIQSNEQTAISSESGIAPSATLSDPLQIGGTSHAQFSSSLFAQYPRYLPPILTLSSILSTSLRISWGDRCH